MLSKVKYQNNKLNNLPLRILLSVIYILSVGSIEFFFDQNDFFSVFPIYIISFISLLGLYFFGCSVHWVVSIGVLIRIGMIFLFPGFSDDIYRFYWDGRLIVSGISPYGILPVDVLKLNLPFLDQTLYNQLNSQEYYTIYPAVNQIYFVISALAGSIQKAAIVMKILIIGTEMAGMYYLLKLMRSYELNTGFIILYFLNPIVIIEGVGNLHFEVVMLAFLCISLYYIFNDNLIKGAFTLSLSIGVKLLPLMLLPYFLFRMKSKKRILFFSSLLFFLILLFLPILYSVDAASFLNSIDLYFRKFEFNAGVYYVLRYFGHLISGYNLISYIGPGLAILTLLLNMLSAAKSDKYSIYSFFKYGLFVWTIYLLLATTVHPWYIISLLFFGVASDYKYPFVWSFLVFLSYANYSSVPYFENLWFIALEYILLALFFIWEFKNKWYKTNVVGVKNNTTFDDINE